MAPGAAVAGRSEQVPERAVAEEIERLVDQVFIVEQAAAVLLGAEFLDHRIGDGEQGGAAVARLDGATALHQGPDAVFAAGADRREHGAPANRPHEYAPGRELAPHVSQISARPTEILALCCPSWHSAISSAESSARSPICDKWRLNG